MEPQGPSEDLPAVIRGKINGWKIVHYTKEDWCRIFEGRRLKFRQGRKTFTSTPYWEQLCEFTEITLSEFFELSAQSTDYWLYFDYKYLKDIFPNDKSFISEIKWSELELTILDQEESALWIGNAGAHTPCHQDTYGCNVVAQLFGRKMWILIPPEESESLSAVRVPYEESSVYSLCNFFTPNETLLRVKRAYKVILAAGDVLYVPRHWWHYVENLEAAISINIWLPLAEDHQSRLEESLVQHYVSSICRDLTAEESKQILNPNEFGLLSTPCALSTVEKCLESCRKHKGKTNNKVRGKLGGEMATLEKLDMAGYIDERSRIFGYSPSVRTESGRGASNRVSLAKALINWYCRPSNITSVSNLLLESD